MATLPSVSDLVTTIFLLLPGFLSLNLIRFLGKLEFTLTDLETTIWSLAGSLAIDTLFVAFLLASNFVVGSLEDVQTALLNPWYGILFLLVTVTGGVMPGLFVRYAFRRKVFVGAIWDTTYSLFRMSKTSVWVVVYTSDQREYQGKLIGMSKGKNIAHEVILREPEQIVRSTGGEMTGVIELGAELYIRDEDIKRIAFSEPLFKGDVSTTPNLPAPAQPTESSAKTTQAHPTEAEMLVIRQRWRHVFLPTIVMMGILTTILSYLFARPFTWLFLVTSILAYILGDVAELIIEHGSGKVSKDYSLLLRGSLLTLAIIGMAYVGSQLPSWVINFLSSPVRVSIATAFTAIVLTVYLMMRSNEFKEVWRAYRRTRRVAPSPGMTQPDEDQKFLFHRWFV